MTSDFRVFTIAFLDFPSAATKNWAFSFTSRQLLIMYVKVNMFPDINFVHSSRVTCRPPDYSHTSSFYVPYTTIYKYLLYIPRSYIYLYMYLKYKRIQLAYSSTQTEPYGTPLEIAATNGHPQTVERLLEGGALINHQRPVCYCNTIIAIIVLLIHT